MTPRTVSLLLLDFSHVPCPPASWRYRYTRKFSSSLVTAMMYYLWAVQAVMSARTLLSTLLEATAGQFTKS